jgi:hypothetical protein
MRFILLASVSALSLSAFAQKNLTVEVADRPMSKGSKISYMVEVPQAKLKDVEKDWLRYTAQNSKGKATTANGEYLQTGAVNVNISPDHMLNIYSKLFGTVEGVRITAWFAENDTLFVQSDSTRGQHKAIEKYVRDFGVMQYRDAVKLELNAAQSKLKALKKDLAGQIRSEEKASDKISDDKRSIDRSNDAIATNKSDQGAASTKIEAQKGMVESTSGDANANKGAKKTLNKNEDEKKTLQRKNDTQSKSIDNKNKNIRAEERNKANAQTNQATKTDAIDKQTLVVQEIQAKLDGIK